MILSPGISKYFLPVFGHDQVVVQRWGLKQVNRIIADSEASKSDVERITGFPSCRIDVVHLLHPRVWTNT